ncbi:unnamed protein product [Durusdinium trenchii]|uniref:Ubiquitin-like domain-containing protein n=1 Tax=Durusdinium trenchii TaxID=1381693 RepID=A0ABP0P3C7_9DINO
MAKQVEGKLCVARANGQQFDVKFDGSDTTLTLKARLYDQMVEGGQSEAVQCSGMKLLHGLDILHDDWVLKDHGIEDGAHLTLVISSFPSGTYNFVSRRDNAPAGSNTTARVQVSFHQDGAFSLSIHESEITSLVRFTDSDPYQMGERYAHEYSGKATAGEEKQIVLKVLDYQRKGIRFQSDPHADLIGEMQESMDEIRLQLPFEAGACNEGKAGLKWISLLKSFKDWPDCKFFCSCLEVKTSDDADLPGAPHPDPFAPPEEPDPAAPGGRDTFLAALHRRRFEAVGKAHPGSAPSAKLADIFRISELATMTASFLCLADASRLRELSRGTRAVGKNAVFRSHPDARALFVSGCQHQDLHLETISHFDPTRHCWRSVLDVSASLSLGSRTFCVPTLLGVDGFLYVCGAQQNNDTMCIHRFDALKSRWTTLPPLPTSRSFCNNWPAISCLEGRIYVCGGSSNDEDYLSAVDCFDPLSFGWEALAPMGTPRACAAAAVLQGKLYVCGGETGTSSLDDFMALDTAERLKPGGSWETLPPMSEPRGGDANGEPNIVACVLEGCLYVRGGHEVDSMERFDPLTHRWESLPPMQTPRYYAAMVAFNHRIYVCGGKDDNDSEELSSVEGFDPETGCWEVLPSMNSKRANAGIVASGGYVYICGGRIYSDSGPSTCLRSVERYCLARRCWELLPPIPETCEPHSLLLV